MKTFFIAGRSKEFESASGQFLNTISGDSDSARGDGGLASLESGAGVYKASFRKVREFKSENKSEINVFYVFLGKEACVIFLIVFYFRNGKMYFCYGKSE